MSPCYCAALGLATLLAGIATVQAATPVPRAPPAARPAPPCGQEQATPAFIEWQRIADEFTPRLVRFKGLSPDERKAERKPDAFQKEIARIGEFVRKYERSEPDMAGSARIFLATQILQGALERDREAVVILRDVAAHAESGLVAGLGAVHAGQILLGLGDEAGLQELRTLYLQREAQEKVFVERLEELCRKVRLLPGRAFPPLPLTDQAGAPIDWNALAGKVVAVLAFSVENDAAFAELKELAAAAADPQLAPLAAVGISADTDVGRLRRELAAAQARFPVAGDGKGFGSAALKELGVTALPALFVIDPKGKILVARSGPGGAPLRELLAGQIARCREQGLLPARGG